MKINVPDSGRLYLCHLAPPAIIGYRSLDWAMRIPVSSTDPVRHLPGVTVYFMKSKRDPPH